MARHFPFHFQSQSGRQGAFAFLYYVSSMSLCHSQYQWILAGSKGYLCIEFARSTPCLTKPSPPRCFSPSARMQDAARWTAAFHSRPLPFHSSAAALHRTCSGAFRNAACHVHGSLRGSLIVGASAAYAWPRVPELFRTPRFRRITTQQLHTSPAKSVLLRALRAELLVENDTFRIITTCQFQYG